MERRRGDEGKQDIVQAFGVSVTFVLVFAAILTDCGRSEISGNQQRVEFQGGYSPITTQSASAEVIREIQEFQDFVVNEEVVNIGGIEFYCAVVTSNNPNAFRTIYEAWEPGWESPPYAYIPKGKGVGKAKIVDDWDLLSIVQLGDRVCVIDP